VSHISHKQLVRYGVVGGIGNLAMYLFYCLMTYYGAGPKAAMTSVYILGAVLSFFGNRWFTFSHKGAFFQSGTRFVIVHLSGYLLNFFILSIFVDILGESHLLAQAIAIFVVSGFLFASLKFFVFGDTRANKFG
jgi:putative flippase GtrA